MSAHSTTDTDFRSVLCPDETCLSFCVESHVKKQVGDHKWLKGNSGTRLNLLHSTPLEETSQTPLFLISMVSCVSPGCSEHPYWPTPPSLSQSCHVTTPQALSLASFQISRHKTSGNEVGRDRPFLWRVRVRQAAGNGGAEEREGARTQALLHVVPSSSCSASMSHFICPPAGTGKFRLVQEATPRSSNRLPRKARRYMQRTVH